MTEEDVARVLGDYDLGQLQICRRVGHGYVNENWFVETTTGRYFLKRRHPRLKKPHLISAQHALVQHLRSVGFPAPAIVPARHGTTFLELQSEMYELQDYIPGDLCDLTRPAHFAAAARTLGWYHNAVNGFDRRFFHQSRERYGPTALRQIVDRLRENWYGLPAARRRLPVPIARQTGRHGRTSAQLDLMMGKLREHARDLRVRFDEFKRLPELVVHGDYYAENLIFQGDVVAGVVDYDLAHRCSRAMELAEALIYFTAERPGDLKHIVYPGVLDLSAIHRFLAAYTEVASLQESEIRVLPHLIRTIWLCASLDPPLEPLLSLEAAPQALPEILTLAGWAEANASKIVQIGLAAQAK